MAERKKHKSILAYAPVIIFICLVALFLISLTTSKDRQNIPSVLIDKPLPQLTLEPLKGIEKDGIPVPAFDSKTLTEIQKNSGQVALVNVWASWCAPCRQEHPFLTALSSRSDLLMVGVNYKDKAKQAIRFLEELGNPFDVIGIDPNGRAAIELGVYGVPETFVISPKGNITYKHVGPILTADDQKKILQKISEAYGK